MNKVRLYIIIIMILVKKNMFTFYYFKNYKKHPKKVDLPNPGRVALLFVAFLDTFI